MTTTEVGPDAAWMAIDNTRVCARWGLRYDWRKSASPTLKIACCSSPRERAGPGYAIEAPLRFERAARKLNQSPEIPDHEPAGSRLIGTLTPSRGSENRA